LQFSGIDHDLILLLEAADACDFGDALRRDQVIANDPILNAAKFGQRSLRAKHDLFVNPTDTAGVRPESGRDALRQSLRGEVQIFQHT
jgi:hypothetical protein